MWALERESAPATGLSSKSRTVPANHRELVIAAGHVAFRNNSGLRAGCYRSDRQHRPTRTESLSRSGVSIRVARGFRSSLSLFSFVRADRRQGPEQYLQSHTDILPGRPTAEEHRAPQDDLRDYYKCSAAAPITLVAGEYQTHDFYVTVGPMFSDPLARQLYAEISPSKNST